MAQAQVSLDFGPLRPSAMGGGLEGAERTSRETINWNPVIMSPDQQINPVKDMADARVRDIVQNDGYAQGIVGTFRDSVVGDRYHLNAQPEHRVLGGSFDETWAEEFQEAVEARFNLMGAAQENWIDASGKADFTGIMRLSVVVHAIFGECLGTLEWITSEPNRPFKTAYQSIIPTRLCNPDGLQDDERLRAGVKLNAYGRPIGYFIQTQHPSDMLMNAGVAKWKYVTANHPWGRRKVSHIFEPLLPGQNRGVADMVAALKTMRMTRQFEEVVLQNAVINASYAASIESELPQDVVYGALGAGQTGFTEMLTSYLSAMNVYAGAAGKAIQIDGAKIPHLFPGTKLNTRSLATPGGIGDGFQEALLRHVAAALGCSYEEFSKDFTKTNYSSARASMAATNRTMSGRKKLVADGKANFIYAGWLEEELYAGNLPLPVGVRASLFRDPVMRTAIAQATWIGASKYQIDELKETQSSVLRMNNNMSTLEAESAAQGKDWRKVLVQKAREQRLAKKLGIEMSTDAAKPGANMRNQIMTDRNEDNEDSNAEN